MRRIAIICLLASISVVVNAQSLTITPEVKSLDERKVVEYNDTICAIEGATVIYRMTVEDYDSIESVSVCQYTFNNVEYDASYNLVDGEITIEDIPVPLVGGLNQFSFKLSIQETGEEDLTELSKEATAIQIYPIPTLQVVSSPSSLVFKNETDELIWTAHGDGGAKWEFIWTSTEDLTDNGETFVHPSIINNGTTEMVVTVNLSATNYAPDGVTIWDSYSEDWTITILPSANVTTSVTPNTINNPYKLFQGDSWDLSVSTEGGNSDGWIIEWLDVDNNILLGQGLECRVTGSSSESIENKHIILHVTNSAPEGDDSVLFDEVYHYYVRFYPIPQIAFSASYPENVLDGEKIQMGVKLIDTQLAEDYYVVGYEWNGNNNAGASYLFEAKNGGRNDSIQQIVTAKCSLGLVDSDAKSSSTKEISHTFIVWPETDLRISEKETDRSNPYRQFQDGKWEFKVDTYGGYPTGWKIVWKDENGKELGQGEKYTMKCDASSDGVQEKHVILTITNRAQGRTDLWFEHSYNYYAAFYPAPIVKFEKEYPHDIKHGDKVVLKLTVMDAKGNSLGDAYDWNVSWNKGQSKNISYEFVGENQSNNDGITKKIEVDCSIELKGTDLKQTYSREADFVVWPIPHVTATNIENRVGCAGQAFDFSITTSGGKKDGWSYVWILNNQIIDVNSNTYNLTLENSSINDAIINQYKVRVTNICDNEVWYEAEYPFTVTVYPEPKVPERIIVMDFNRGVEVSSGIREGNNIILHCDECTGGNPNAWSYKWLRNNSVLGTNNEINEKLTSNYSGSGKSSDLIIVYDCLVENTYNSVSWKKQEYKKEIRVYRKPQTPTGLQRKGNGTSGTWIATCGIDDTSLSANDYYLVFGYRDANGKMHDVSTMNQQNVGEQRWSTSNAIIDGNAYVYALWKYDDGSEVTSGLCMESSIEESWDGSTYDGSTRSVIDAATGINVIPSIQTQITEYYSPDGIKNNQLKRGLNIVRTQDGQVVKIINNK